MEGGYTTEAGDARGATRGRDDRGGHGGASSGARGGDSRGNPPPKRERSVS